ncbi:zinc carboxypeptidase family protein (macronuclear) [Tetrahymena thermophila SB210]|uniref:Cytosolic carboxypeptidase-like protein 5 n=1 Tax=Tetrahymena thermophila (strain SB210) TaxID=312017 RepID=Q23W15_TETTS|nr:zinc carboxypeptidase family protein [Tetrahymena thermophila SB210]EAS00690.3 zinc carboxypeptidase family protein [Tetrahymena thermophila SB210]|eukprot:XP_001020935.3 zinc carboxypeptidase family protein [Tetrahymena thermophila SB210]
MKNLNKQYQGSLPSNGIIEGLPVTCNPNVHYQRTSEQFGTIIFNSDFDSGNMLKVERNYESPGNQFNVWISPDAYMTQKEMKYRTWFYFSVTGVPQNNLVYITIKNTNFQQKLYREGHQPVYKSSYTNSWQRIAQSVANTVIQHETGIDFTFSHVFQDPEEVVYFAFTYPWSYQDNQDMLDLLDQKFINSPDLYYHRTTLIQSKEYRNVELLTISSHSNKLEEKIQIPQDQIFPFLNQPNLFSDKKYVFISTRVHPGEVPGSHVFNGMLQLLLNKDDARSKVLRDHFVFVMIPIINPDGVSRGHYRTDSQGQNLNRFYINPSQQDQPEIYGIKELLMFLNSKGLLYCYLDLHAHATKKGSFIYGNCMDYRSQVESNLLTKLMSLNTPFFEFDLCNFTERNMYSKDKSDGLSKEGSGRVALYKQTKIPFCYTLECNYNSPNNINTMYPRSENYHFEENSVEMNELNINIVQNNISFEQSQSEFPYVPSNYSNLGEGMLEALLDYNKINPISRLPNSPYKTYTNLKMQMAYQIMKSIPYRFENYLRKVMRHINSSDNVFQSFKILNLFVEKGLKSSQINETENTTVVRKSSLQGGQLLLQNQQLKKKTVIIAGKQSEKEQIQPKVSYQELKMEFNLKGDKISSAPVIPPSKKISIKPPTITQINEEKPLKESGNSKRQLDSKENKKHELLNFNEADLIETQLNKMDLKLNRPSYKSQISGAGDLKINKVIQQAKLEANSKNFIFKDSSQSRSKNNSKKKIFTQKFQI